MDFLEIERRKMTTKFDMSEPHSHDYYELYFLLEGKREFFARDKTFLLPSGSFCVVPPFCLHKTEGGAYERVNVNISETLLKKEEIRFLNECAKVGALRLDEAYRPLLVSLLREGVTVRATKGSLRRDYEASIARTVLYLLQKQVLTPISTAAALPALAAADPVVWKTVFYINEHYRETITLDLLSAKCFLSKVALCARFKKVMHCSIMQYLFQIRLSKAKELLSSTEKSMEEIACDCGFSSANYFSLVFKKEVGLSPLYYKKTR
ncbi:MAG: helix-turn-helix domain-containing protein [Clostridia bacterium]|nr:helix-turn-helix domain-containing protein [Clostridia bacterium]